MPRRKAKMVSEDHPMEKVRRADGGVKLLDGQLNSFREFTRQEFQTYERDLRPSEHLAGALQLVKGLSRSHARWDVVVRRRV